MCILKSFLLFYTCFLFWCFQDLYENLHHLEIQHSCRQIKILSIYLSIFAELPVDEEVHEAINQCSWSNPHMQTSDRESLLFNRRCCLTLTSRASLARGSSCTPPPPPKKPEAAPPCLDPPPAPGPSTPEAPRAPTLPPIHPLVSPASVLPSADADTSALQVNPPSTGTDAVKSHYIHLVP